MWVQFPSWCKGSVPSSHARGPKSAHPLNEVRVPNALPEYYIKYSQIEKAKSD